MSDFLKKALSNLKNDPQDVREFLERFITEGLQVRLNQLMALARPLDKYSKFYLERGPENRVILNELYAYFYGQNGFQKLCDAWGFKVNMDVLRSVIKPLFSSAEKSLRQWEEKFAKEWKMEHSKPVMRRNRMTKGRKPGQGEKPYS